MAGGQGEPTAEDGATAAACGIWTGDWAVVKDLLTLAEHKELEVHEALLGLRERQVSCLGERLAETQAEIRGLCPLEERGPEESPEPTPEGPGEARAGRREELAPEPEAPAGDQEGGGAAAGADVSSVAAGGGEATAASSAGVGGGEAKQSPDALRSLREKDQLISLGLKWLAAELHDATLQIGRLRCHGGEPPALGLEDLRLDVSSELREESGSENELEATGRGTLDETFPASGESLPRTAPDSLRGPGQGPLPPPAAQELSRLPASTPLPALAEDDRQEAGGAGAVDAAVAALLARPEHRHWRHFLCRLGHGRYLLGAALLRLRIGSPSSGGFLEASRDCGATWGRLEDALARLEASPPQAELARRAREIELLRARRRGGASVAVGERPTVVDRRRRAGAAAARAARS